MSDLRTLTAVMHPWKNAQCPMGETKRWGNFPDYGQNLLMHNNSVPWVAEWVISEVSRTHAIDQALLYRAFIVHDHGEPLTGGDEHIDDLVLGEAWLIGAALGEGGEIGQDVVEIVGKL